MMRAELDRELERQQRLLQSILSPGGGLLQGWLRPHLGEGPTVAATDHPAPPTAKRGLLAYVAHAGATAERALSAAYPTVQTLVGDETFALLARALWREQPPQRGDLGRFGDAFADFIGADEQLADVPYLRDIACLDWAVAQAESAADVDADVASFHALTDVDPQQLEGLLAAGGALVPSDWPIVTVWRAHQADAADDAFALARAAVSEQRGEIAWVWRSAWKAQVRIVSPAEARFLQALLERASLSQALSEAGGDFDFALMLQQGLQQGWWAGIRQRD